MENPEQNHTHKGKMDKWLSTEIVILDHKFELFHSRLQKQNVEIQISEDELNRLKDMVYKYHEQMDSKLE